MSNPTIEKIENEIKSSKVVLFVKGTPAAPQCGFSAQAMQIFTQIGVPFHTVDVIANPEIRRELPNYSKWPTFPQIFVNGKLIGGCDILREMHESGDLEPLVKS